MIAGIDRHRRSRTSRTAFTLIEMLLALMLLGVLFSVFVPLLLTVAHERRDAVREQVALQHAANVLEEVTLRTWEALQEPLTGPELPADQQPLLPNFEQTVTADTMEGTPTTRRITVKVSWKHRSGQRTQPLLLHGWVTAPQEPKP